MINSMVLKCITINIGKQRKKSAAKITKIHIVDGLWAHEQEGQKQHILMLYSNALHIGSSNNILTEVSL